MQGLVGCLFVALLASPALSQLGGVKQTDAGDQDVANAASFAVKHRNRGENSLYALVLTSVLESSSQVVAGVKYQLVIEAKRSSNCRNDGSEHSLCSCTVDESQKSVFRAEVISQPWKNPPMEVLSMVDVTDSYSNSLQSQETKSLTIGSAIQSSTGNFQSFLQEHKPVYCNNAVEITKRSSIFEQNMERVKKYQENEQGTAKYGATKFADLTEEEFRQQYLSSTPMEPDTTLKQSPPVKTDDMPTSFDWRQHNAVSPVKNQGSCGSCWSFSTTGNVEGQWAIKKGKLVSLSEQELVDCDKVDHGCQGGLPSNAYKQIELLGGLTTEDKYPYTGKNGQCRFNKEADAPLYYVNGSMALPKDEAQLAAWLAKNGPVSIGINAGPMQFYFGGISHPLKVFCNPKHLDHGVLIVGYGVQGSEPYWIIKNSWGSSWGEKGYYLVYRGEGVCGLNLMATSSVVN